MRASTDIQTGLYIAPYFLIAIGGYYLYKAIKNKRVFKDTPTSKIHSAAQGYVQLEGKAQKYDNHLCMAPHTKVPCLWFDMLLERREGSGKDTRWVEHERVTSDSPFLIQDKTGWCLVNTTRADVIESHKVVEYLDSYRGKANLFNRYYRVTERVLLPKAEITVIGEYKTIRKIDTMANSEEMLTSIVQTWKADYDALLKKYDTDGNGELDQQEWERVLADARNAVQQERTDAQSEEGINTIAFPVRHRKPFVISALTEEEVVKKYTLWQWLSIGAIILGVGIMVKNPPSELFAKMAAQKSTIEQVTTSASATSNNKTKTTSKAKANKPNYEQFKQLIR